MANDKTTRVINRIDTQERAILKMAGDLARTVTDSLSLAADHDASDYQKVRGLAPLLKQMGALGDMAEKQITWHDNLLQTAKAAGMTDEELQQRSGPGRDKD